MSERKQYCYICNFAVMTLFLILLQGASFSQSSNPKDEYDDEEYYEDEYETIPAKLLFLDVGSGYAGLSCALGFRYWFFGASIGISGFANDVPNYIKDFRQFPKPSTGEEERYTTLVVTGDVYLYYDINEQFTVFGNLGYYSQQDTILLRAFDTDYRYMHEAEVKSGACYGLGGQYNFTEQLLIGIGYHTRRGIYGEIGYMW